jgi:virulence-associated protein VagC
MKLITKYSLIISIITILMMLWGVRNYREIRRLRNNLNARTIEYEDKLGRTVTQSQAYQVTIRELKQARRVDSLHRTEYEQKLAEAIQTVDILKKKLSRVESVNTVVIESKKTDTVYIHVDEDSLIIEPIRSKHWNIDFTVLNHKLMVADMTYTAQVDIVIDRDKSLKPDGRKRFILCRIIRPNWVYNSSAVVDDPDAKIKTNVYFRFKN